MKLEWMKEVDYEDLLTEDCKLVLAHCGEDTLFSMLEKLAGLHLFISTKPIKEAQKRYIRKHYNGQNIKQLAIKLGASERFVYQVLRDEKKDL